MNYKVFATNKAAHDAVERALNLIDKRLAIGDEDKRAVCAYALAHRHRESIHIFRQQKLTTALVEADVLGRTKGNTNFFVKSTFASLSDLAFDTEDDGTLRAYTTTRSGLWVKSQKAADTVAWGDVGGLGFGGAYFFGIKDAAATLAAFLDNATPSVNFQQCDYERKASPEEVKKFRDCFLDQAWRSGTAVAPIADEGDTLAFVVANPDAAVAVAGAATTRFLNRFGPRFSVVTRDRYGREVSSWGCYTG